MSRNLRTSAAASRRAAISCGIRLATMRPHACRHRHARTADPAIHYRCDSVLRRLPRIAGVTKVADQLAAAAGSVGANHRAMRRARSRREFSAKLQTVVEEADESVFWLEVSTTVCSDIDDAQRLLDEARQLRAIFVKARSTNRERS